MELKKRIVRTAVAEIIVNLDDETQMLRFVVHWKGGTHTQFEMTKPVGASGQSTALDDLEILRKMAVRYGDDEIAYVLNKRGAGPARGSHGTRSAWRPLAVIIRSPARSGQHRIRTFSARGRLPSTPVSARLPFGSTIRKLVAGGVLKREQIVPWAPWEIRRADLDTEPLRGIIEQLQRTGRIIFTGVVSENQMPLIT